MGDLELTVEEIRKVAKYANELRKSKDGDPEKLALLLEIVSLCMLKLQVEVDEGPIPVTGQGVDDWYDLKFGADMRSLAAQLQTPAKILRDIINPQ